MAFFYECTETLCCISFFNSKKFYFLLALTIHSQHLFYMLILSITGCNDLYTLISLVYTKTASHEAVIIQTKKSIVMKKLVTLLTAAMMLLCSFTFAFDSDNVNSTIKAAFSNDFSAAKNVTWKKTSDFYFATFMFNNNEVNAAYNEAGELIGTSRTLAAALLPMDISIQVAKKYEGYSIAKKALELSFEGTTHYYITIMNDEYALKLKCTANGSLQVEKKIKRS
ncbi:hypothetical protein BH11BAC3_BH11BAC3_03050 [soil metagenome]